MIEMIKPLRTGSAEQIDTDRIKSSIDLRELAASYTTLRRESVNSLAGPCPKCGGDDRFCVKAQTFSCRKCHPKWGDAIEFMTWVHNVPFKEAAAMLTGGAMPAQAERRQPEKRQPMAREWNADRAAQELERYQAALWDEVNDAPHDYLENKRGLDAHTWLMFGLGYRHQTLLPGTWKKGMSEPSHPPQPALAIPWFHKEKLIAIRYRFLQNHFYVDADGKEQRGKHDKGVKQTAESNSNFGHIFGGHAIRRYGLGAPEERILIIVEGEINAMSIFQVARDTGLDVLSLGSESQKLPQETITYAQRYRRVMVWSDREEIAEQLQAAIPGAFAVTSEMCGGKDANDLLQAHHLGGYLSAWRFQMCQDAADRAALYGDLQAAANTWSGLDAGSLAVMGAIAA